MVMQTDDVARHTPNDAAELLAQIIANAFGGCADAEGVRRLIRDKWRTLSALALAVHNDELVRQ